MQNAFEERSFWINFREVEKHLRKLKLNENSSQTATNLIKFFYVAGASFPGGFFCARLFRNETSWTFSTLFY